jgi:hypothetical protein
VASGTAEAEARRPKRVDRSDDVDEVEAVELSSEEIWARRWSFAKFTLRMSEDDFWDSTPRTLSHLVARLESEQELQLWDTARKLASLHNVGQRRSEKDWLSPWDFMPSKSAKKRKVPKTKMGGMASFAKCVLEIRDIQNRKR